LGISVQTLTPEIARQLGLNERDQGVVVTKVDPGSLAAAAGIRPRDLILAVGGSQVRTLDDFKQVMSKQGLAEGIRILVNTGGFQRFVFLKSSR
jgi:serine protease Do